MKQIFDIFYNIKIKYDCESKIHVIINKVNLLNDLIFQK